MANHHDNPALDDAVADATPEVADGAGGARLMFSDSTLSAGVAGSMTMMIANTVGSLVVLPLAWVALAVSMLFAALLDVGAVSPVRRIAFFALNSLIIFAVSAGTNNLGQDVSMSAGAQELSAIVSPVTVAHAQDADTSAEVISETISQILDNPNLSAEEKVKLIQQVDSKLLTNQTEQSSSGFFKAWKF